MDSRYRKKWTAEEIQTLEDLWGEETPYLIAQHLGRTVGAVIIMSKRLGLGGYFESSEYLNAYNITQIMGLDSHVVQRTWKRYGFKMQKKKVRGDFKFEVIRIDKLLEWLEAHQDLWDSRRVEEYALGTEPEWLKKKREQDRLKPKFRGNHYTAEEDNKVVMMTRLGKTHAEIAKALNRSKASVNARVRRLDIWGTGRAKNAN